MELTIEELIEIEASSKLMVEKLKAIFLLSGIEVKETYQLPNGYLGDFRCPGRPWMLADTVKYGLMKIGWRKRVINIEWPKTIEVLGKDVLSLGDEWVTSFENGVHAYGYAKAIENLTKFVELEARLQQEKSKASENEDKTSHK